MNEPLGKFVGNALEVFECVKILRNEIDEAMLPTLELSIVLTARMLVLTGIAPDTESAERICRTKLRNGSALERFQQNITLQGGDAGICDEPDRLFDSGCRQMAIKSPATGFVAGIDALAIGESIGRIGGGRFKVDDVIDHAVGYQCEKKIADHVKAGETLGVLFCRNEAHENLIGEKLQTAYRIGEERPEKFPLIKEIIF
jgi:pyrimidine-nucleoside phosphorylase